MSKLSSKRIKEVIQLKEYMTFEQKQKLLKVLKTVKEEYTGNVGGETDITYADNLQVNEDEYTGTGVTKETPNVVAKTFDTKSDFDSYVNQRRGIEITRKELQAVQNYGEAKPTEMDKFHIQFETTDDFGNNNTTIIKKLKEENKFCWTAFSKYETAEDEGNPEKQADANSGENNEVTVNDPIRITKSITFSDETEGYNILSDFLNTLEL